MTSAPLSRFVWSATGLEQFGPGPRSRHGLVGDRNAGAVVLFGGIVWRNSRFPTDTWELRKGSWRQVSTSETPPGRHRGAMVFDSQRGCTVLFGGQAANNSMLGDLWIYEDHDWRQHRRGFWTSWPSRRCGHMLAFDESLGAVVLFGGIDSLGHSLGDTWTFDGSSWKRVSGISPSARRYGAFAYDPDLKGCVLHGGAFDDAGHQQFGDSWLFRYLTWSRLPSGHDTDVRDDHGLGFHRKAGKLLMLEGLGGERGILGRSDEGWLPADAANLHPRHQCSPLAWDEKLQGLVMHGGETGHGGRQYEQTWVLQVEQAE